MTKLIVALRHFADASKTITDLTFSRCGQFKINAGDEGLSAARMMSRAYCHDVKTILWDAVICGWDESGTG
jgi:hypothetical protein